MKQIFSSLFFCFSALALAACQPGQTDKTDKPVLQGEAGMGEAVAVKTGVVRLRLSPPVSEPYACIFPIRVENGLEDETSVTMIGFNLSGPGEDARGNMFAPRADAGEVIEARVIVEGQSCDAYDTLSIPEIRCTSGEENCATKVELIDGGGLRFAKSG